MLAEYPDYCEDLDAMFRLTNDLRKLPGPEWADFAHELVELCGSTTNAMNAPARDRAVAYLRTIAERKPNAVIFCNTDGCFKLATTFVREHCWCDTCYEEACTT